MFFVRGRDDMIAVRIYASVQIEYCGVMRRIILFIAKYKQNFVKRVKVSGPKMADTKGLLW